MDGKPMDGEPMNDEPMDDESAGTNIVSDVSLAAERIVDGAADQIAGERQRSFDVAESVHFAMETAALPVDDEFDGVEPL